MYPALFLWFNTSDKMKKKNPAEKLAQKRRQLVERTVLALGASEAEAIDLLQTERTQSLRLNTLRGEAGVALEELKKLGWSGEQYSWYKDGYTIRSGRAVVRDSALLANGLVYIQNAASWLPVLALDAKAGDTVLDVCAAPGGKTSHIAAATSDKASITANDNSRPRLAKLRANLDRLGATNYKTTLYDATQLARKLEGERFNRILLDAPCSGEGMMQYDQDKDFATWSIAQIHRLQTLQKRILSQAWQLLEPGGRLVYSTCTMAPEENEAVIDYFLRKHEDVELVPYTIELPNKVAPVLSWNGKVYDPRIATVLRLKPSEYIEAFFVCVLEKKL